MCRQLGLSEEGTFQKFMFNLVFMVCSMSIKISGAEAIGTQSTPNLYGPSTLSFFALDDVGCNGSESNLLDCLPQHNCDNTVAEKGHSKLPISRFAFSDKRGTENAGVQCLRKGMNDQIYIAVNRIIVDYFRSQIGVWSLSRKQ